jgi:hypothetical protein
MNKSDKVHNKILKSLIMEGGNAVPDVVRIKKNDIPKTIKDFEKNVLFEILGNDFQSDSIFTLGSTGKKPDSGDIDIAIDSNKIKGSILYNLLKINEKCASLGYVSCVNTINYKMIHVAYPQKGYKNKFVQIDVLFTNTPEFTKFFMFSPTNKDSKYKGAHRNDLLHAISKVISYEPIYEDKQGNILKWRQNDIKDNGYFNVIKTLVDNAGHRLKYKSTDEDLEEGYAQEEEAKFITDDVNSVIKILFGKGFKDTDIDTFEKCFDIIKNNNKFIHKNLSENILKECAKSLNDKKDRLEFPKELKKYL